VNNDTIGILEQKKLKEIMQISDIEFGGIDARHEILARDPAKRKLFLESFVVPPSFSLDDLVSGEKFIIVGPKGSGKTAFLRYLQHKLNSENGKNSRFIIFRDDITAQDREKIAQLSQFRLYDSTISADEDVELGGDDDCLSAWQIMIHREIAHVISQNGDLCARTTVIANYLDLLNRFFSSYKTAKFKSYLTKITKGKIKIGALGQALEAEAEFIDNHGNIDPSEFARYCNSAITELCFNSQIEDARINIFFDEINISFVSGSDFKKNSILIRDLIAACGKLNSIFAEHQIPIYIYSAIRSEVVDSVEGSVRELQKWVDDKGVFIDWISRNADYSTQPIVDLVRKRISANVSRAFGDAGRLGLADLGEFFEKDILGLPFAHFMIFETWGRPRDMVRLLGGAARYVKKGCKFDSASFSQSLALYSKGCWDEKSDELNSKYAQSEIETIKRILTGLAGRFSNSEFDARISYLQKNDSRINHFLSGRNVEVLLSDLFKTGVLGNILKTKSGGNRPSYLYMGHTNFNSSEIMCIHRSLWRELQTVSPEPVAPLKKARKEKYSPNSKRHLRRTSG
jgi:hypothetical protein